ncbi:hypothetical protein NSS70_06520 [Aeribacillus sp. FSL K6-2848]|uniref:hypothetical protein n=1 Tax=unclassified Aeribacillus TaxID=2640495 RepID=UPI0030D34E1B
MSHLGHDTERLCIRVPKVYDWVSRQIDLPQLSFRDLSSIGFDCEGVTGTSEDPCALYDDGPVNVNCYLSDSLGNPVDPNSPNAISVTEIVQPQGRQSVVVHLPRDGKITLQKVRVLIRGYIVVTLSDLQGSVTCVSDAIPFATVQTFFLCAPPGTTLNSHVSFFESDANMICDNTSFSQLDISIMICLDVQMEAQVKLEVEGKFCKPRRELPTTLTCSAVQVPPQCPEIFPGDDYDLDV